MLSNTTSSLRLRSLGWGGRDGGRGREGRKVTATSKSIIFIITMYYMQCTLECANKYRPKPQTVVHGFRPEYKIPGRTTSQGEQNGANFSSIAPSSEVIQKTTSIPVKTPDYSPWFLARNGKFRLRQRTTPCKSTSQGEQNNKNSSFAAPSREQNTKVKSSQLTLQWSWAAP